MLGYLSGNNLKMDGRTPLVQLVGIALLFSLTQFDLVFL